MASMNGGIFKEVPEKEERKDKNIHAYKCTRSTKTSSLFPKRGDQNAKTNGETRTQSTRRAREDFKTLSAPWYKPTQN